MREESTLKALNIVARGKSRVIGTPPRVMSVTDKANPVRVLQRAPMTRKWHVSLCNPFRVDWECGMLPRVAPAFGGLTLGYVLEPHSGFLVRRDSLSVGTRLLTRSVAVQRIDHGEESRPRVYSDSRRRIAAIRSDIPASKDLLKSAYFKSTNRGGMLHASRSKGSMRIPSLRI